MLSPFHKGNLLVLNKTLYGLTCSAHHWYTKLLNHLVDDMGFSAMYQDKCVYKCTPIKGQPPIYVGLYVDDLIYYFPSDKVEEWFENNLNHILRLISWEMNHGSLDNNTNGIMINKEEYGAI